MCYTLSIQSVCVCDYSVQLVDICGCDNIVLFTVQYDWHECLFSLFIYFTR